MSLISKFLHNPSEEYINVVVLTLECWKSSPGKGLMFRKYNCLIIDVTQLTARLELLLIEDLL